MHRSYLKISRAERLELARTAPERLKLRKDFQRSSSKRRFGEQENTHYTKHDHEACARCGAAFECKPGTVHECQCFEVHLTRKESEIIGETFEGCLCKHCLQALRDRMRDPDPLYH